MKYLITGDGWIGNRIKDFLGEEATLTKRKLTYDINLNFLEESDFDVLIHTAAKTNIDWCELNKDEAVDINTIIPATLAHKVKTLGKKFVFLSSACVFESKGEVLASAVGKRFMFDEDSKPNPQCWYAKTKVWAEWIVQKMNPDSLIIRLRLPISSVPHPRNTLNKLLTYPQINNNQESITVIEDMLPVMKKLIEQNEKGIFHLINEGTLSPDEMCRGLGYTTFQTVTKSYQDEQMKINNRAKRVTAYVTSNRIPTLPNVRERFEGIAKEFNSWKINH